MSNLMHRIISISKDKGFLYLVFRVFRKIGLQAFYIILFPLYRILGMIPAFSFASQKFAYFYRLDTWYNERVIEVPVARSFINKALAENKKILEIGNVLSHYFGKNYDILDKYEKGEGVLNEDVLTYQPKTKYDLVMTISTLEHVGYDEDPCEPEKVIPSVENIKKMLAPGGKLVATWALGYNKHLDEYLLGGKLGFTETYFYKRSFFNNWKECKKEDLPTDNIYFSRDLNAYYLVVAIYEKGKG